MSGKCPDTSALLALAEGSSAGRKSAGVEQHTSSCRRCQTELAELRALGMALGELGRAERAATSSELWAGIAARMEQRGLGRRLPLWLASVWRQVTPLGQPAVAASAAAGLAGLLFGGWMSIVAWRGPAKAEAVEPYPASSLVTEPESGLTESYLQEIDPAAAKSPDSASGTGVEPSDSGGTSPGGDAP